MLYKNNNKILKLEEKNPDLLESNEHSSIALPNSGTKFISILQKSYGNNSRTREDIRAYNVLSTTKDYRHDQTSPLSSASRKTSRIDTIITGPHLAILVFAARIKHRWCAHPRAHIVTVAYTRFNLPSAPMIDEGVESQRYRSGPLASFKRITKCPRENHSSRRGGRRVHST